VRQPAQIVSRLARIALFALSTLFPLAAGPLGFQDWDQFEHEDSITDCGSCSFITSYQTIPLAPDPRETTIILGTMAALAVIGFIGLRLRVRL
jgi:hypothetical protein